MDRRELLALRKSVFERVERCKAIGDYGAGAKDIREGAEDTLKLIDHLLEKFDE
jgi:hypothetical protein